MLLANCSAVPLVKGESSASQYCARELQHGQESNAALTTHIVATVTKITERQSCHEHTLAQKKQLSASHKLTKGVFKHTSSEIKHSSSWPLTKEQWVSWNNLHNAPFAGTSSLSSMFLASPYALITFSMHAPYFSSIYSSQLLPVPPTSMSESLGMKHHYALLQRDKMQHWNSLCDKVNLAPGDHRRKTVSSRRAQSGTQLKVKGLWRTSPVRGSVMQPGWPAGWQLQMEGGLLFPHAVIPLSPVSPTPGATCTAQPLLWQEPY